MDQIAQVTKLQLKDQPEKSEDYIPLLQEDNLIKN